MNQRYGCLRKCPSMSWSSDRAMSDSERLERLCTACLEEGLDVQIRATGLSMQPTISDGALIRIQAIDPADVRSGDIILYRKGRGVIAHRVVVLIHRHRQLVGFTTRGDASSTCYASVPVSQVLGKVVSIQGRAVARAIVTQRLKGRWRGLLHRFQSLNFLK